MSTGNHPAKPFLERLQWAIAQRRIAMQGGWNRLDVTLVRKEMTPLQMWLRFHPTYASMDSVKQLWAQHESAIRFVMPSNAAGKKRLREMEELVARA